MSVTSGGPFNSRAKMGGGYVGGGPSPILNPRKMSTHGYSGSPRYSADSMFSIAMGLTHGEDFDYEGSTFEEEEGEDMMIDDDVIIELALESVIKAEKSIVSLEETLIGDEDDEDDDKSEFEEITTVGSVGGMGWTGPLKSPDVSRKKWRQMMTYGKAENN